MNRDSLVREGQNIRRLRVMIDALPSPVLIEDEHRSLLCVNQAFCKMFAIGGDPEDLIGVDCAVAAERSKYLFANPEGYIEGIETTLANRKAVSEETLMMADGRVLQRSYTPIFLDDQYQGHFWQYEDITHMRIVARELEASRDRAWEASRLKSEFLAIMSHEIRTPMNGVIGMSELLLSTNLDDIQRDYATVIYEESHALLRILNDILDFSKIEAGKVELDPVPFSLYELVASIADITRHEAARKGLALQLHLPPDVPMLYGDGGRVRQIIVNLMNNAIKFTKRGGVSLMVDAAPTPDKRVALRFDVRDTGIGIAPDKLEALFEPFTQADGSTTRKYGGTGLGLAIVKRLVNLLGGQIQVASEPGRGTIFTVQVQVDLASAHIEEYADETPGPNWHAAPPPVESFDRRILVVEDNAANRMLIVDYLNMLGYQNLDLAEDGDEAVRMVQASPHPYALVLMDLQMPRMDGLTATRLIRQHEAGLDRHTPVVALTAHALPEYQTASQDAGMDDFLVKPVQRAKLVKVLSSFLGAGQSGDDQGAAR
ncbi:MAG: response regulator [Chloroflexi bacterium]|nr:response regulator [Chloroflexota bacterium]